MNGERRRRSVVGDLKTGLGPRWRPQTPQTKAGDTDLYTMMLKTLLRNIGLRYRAEVWNSLAKCSMREGDQEPFRERSGRVNPL